ncbi:MAG TPA: glycosyltransferase family 2 protein [Granulicella sp.]|nr:glycosyltransferase family 2 protein [Granulicella sp.]
MIKVSGFSAAEVSRRSSDPSAALRRVEFAVVLPTYNERENIGQVICRLEMALDSLSGGMGWEIVFVDDDSPDGTAEVVREFARRDSRVRLVHRVGRRGLSSACIEGILATTANYIAVMDADLQHDEAILPKMLDRLREESLDVVIGTRNAMGGSMGQFSKKRVLLSRMGNAISHAVCRCAPSDPMSGFFVVRRSFFLEVVSRLQGNGFKILVDMLSSSERPVRFGEVGYTFRKRTYGESKLDVNTAVEYLFLVLNKAMGGVVPVRFAMFALVGATGMLAHLGCLAVLLFGLHMKFLQAQVIATVVAMTENFFLNNLITYRDRKLRGVRLVTGLLSFYLACSFGAWANVVFARALLSGGAKWYLAGLAGIVLSSVWNYSINNLFTWQMPVPCRRADAEVETLAEQVDILH